MIFKNLKFISLNNFINFNYLVSNKIKNDIFKISFKFFISCFTFIINNKYYYLIIYF